MSASSVFTLEEDEYDVGRDVKDVDDDDDDPVSEGGNSLMSAESVYTQIKQAHDIMQGAAATNV